MERDAESQAFRYWFTLTMDKEDDCCEVNWVQFVRRLDAKGNISVSKEGKRSGSEKFREEAKKESEGAKKQGKEGGYDYNG